MPKSVCFDVLGTCFTIDSAIDTIQSRVGNHLQRHNVEAKTLFFSWFYAAQRDFTYLSLADAYQPIAQVLKHTFKRACAIVDIPPDTVTAADVDAIMQTVKTLPPRPGLKKCHDGLREAGWDVYAVTNGGKETSLGYYKLANIELDTDHMLSCDDIQVAKPDARVYELTHRHLTKWGGGSPGDGERWFVAAHAWDLVAARKAGFKTAFIEHEEHDPVTVLFGQFDLYAKDMEDLLEKMRNL